MKGVIFNVVEDVVTEQFGADVWDDLLARADLDGAYTSLGSYPDDDLTSLVQAASEALGIPPADVLRLLGRRAMPVLAGRYPAFFAGHTSCLTYLLTLNDIIHPEVRKLYPGAAVPDFGFSSSDANELRIVYRSARRLCALAEGFIEGAADHFGERVTLNQPWCLHRGDPDCTIVCRVESTG